MQYESHKPYRRRTRRRTQYDGRSYARGGPDRKPERSPSKRREHAEEALRSVLDLFDSGELPERVAQTVIAQQAGTSPMVNWSLGNQLLAIIAGTTDARGYRQWQEAGRHVRKGSKALYILAPSTRKIREQDETTGEETERTAVVGFLGVPVFRYEDTEGAALEQPDYDPPQPPPLRDVAARLGVDVSYAPFVGDARGYYQSGRDRIVLMSHDERVFFHELAHAAHQRVLGDRGEALKGGQLAGQEIVAETVAATLCRLYGLDGYIWAGAEYVRHYAAGNNPARAAMRVLGDVQAVLNLILDPWGEHRAATAGRELAAA
jgi:antirestriction protein ArdC